MYYYDTKREKSVRKERERNVDTSHIKVKEWWCSLLLGTATNKGSEPYHAFSVHKPI